MKYLEEFRINFGDFQEDTLAPIESLVDLPIKKISSLNFEFKKETIEGIVKTLSSIETLEDFRIFNSDYKLSVAEFAMFKDLPVVSLYLEALDLKSTNIAEFGKIMRQMEINFLECYDIDCEDLDIIIKSHGPGNIFQTI